MKRLVKLVFLPLVITTVKYGPERTYSQKEFDAQFNMNTTTFPKLENFHVNGNTTRESTYPYIAKVVHSPTLNLPYLCTAVCVHRRLFMTAARCLTGHLLQFMRVHYKGRKLSIAAFVLPLNETKQQFDDIGFIVTKTDLSEEEYNIANITTRRRQHNYFKEWMPILEFGKAKAIGYARGREEEPSKSNYELKEIDIFIQTTDCARIYNSNKGIDAYEVPLYNSCDYMKFLKQDQSCRTYLGVEGAVVLEISSNTILGIATWGYVGNQAYPVGFSTPNGKDFELVYNCAVLLADITKDMITEPLQNTCDQLNNIKIKK